MINPKLLEINTRIWIKRFGENAKLSEVPEKYFEDIAEKGINIIWFMGIWKGCNSIIEKTCFGVDLVSSYSKCLNDWRKADIIGSPFAIDNYEINPLLGGIDDLLELKRKINSLGIKLLLDFIPNHFNASSDLIKTNPEIFLQGDKDFFKRDSFTFFKNSNGKIFAHGRDPLFPAWSDTIQINYFDEQARNFMIDKLLRLTDICDGVRCDMAILPLNNVFQNTWLGVLNKFGFNKPAEEFWENAIKKVKEKNNDFIFLGEAYWDLEWQLQQLGFDFTYDKKLTDRLADNDINGIKAHLTADKEYQLKSTRFLENHDEPRAITKFGDQRSMAAAVVISTIQGLKFYYDGQFEGKKIKVPVQLGREPKEKVLNYMKKFYDKILGITKHDIFVQGEWTQLVPLPAGNNNESFNNFFAWIWKNNIEARVIVVNYSDNESQCRIKFDLQSKHDKIVLLDLLNDMKYDRYLSEINSVGLFIDLKAYNSHIFSIESLSAS